MTKRNEERLEVRIPKELRRSLRVFCARNDLTLREGVELAISRMVKPAPEKNVEAVDSAMATK